MKLARTFTISVAVLVFLVLGSAALVSVDREITLLQTDMRRDHHLLGRALAQAAMRFFRTGGEAAASALIRDANVAESAMRLRLVSLDTGSATTVLDPQALARARAGDEVVVASPDGANLVTYIP